MRWTALTCLLLCGLWIAGCGGSDTPTTAGAGGASPPSPPGSSGPPSPGGDAGGGPGAPADGTPTEGGQPPGGDGASPPATGDSPPDALPTPGTPGGNPPPGGGATAEGGQPPEGASPDGGQPGETNPDGTPRRPPRPQTLREQAMAAFRDGSDAQGLKLLQAHYIVMPDAKDDLVKKMAWYPALARPALGPRIGFAVIYSEASRDFWGNPMPIGSAELTTAVKQLQPSGGSEAGSGSARRSRFGGGGEGSSEPREGSKSDAMSTASGPEQLTYYTGEFGEMLLEALEERFEKGEYGEVPQEVMQEVARRPRGTGDPNDPNGQPSPDAPGGAAPSDGGAPGSGRTRRRTPRASSPEVASLQHVKQLSPGILWLGKADDRDQVVKRAEAASVDILAIFDMNVREARTGSLVSNSTRIRLLTMKPNSPPIAGYMPETLINLDVEKWRQKEQRGTDPVEREVNKAVESLDKVLKPMPLPEALTAERAKKRIADLVAEKPAEPLPVIVEARFYAAKGLLPEEDFTSAAVALLGQNGFAQLKEKAKIGLE